MLAIGLCKKCAAYKGKTKDAMSCHAMTPGCPAPQYMKDEAMKRDQNGK